MSNHGIIGQTNVRGVALTMRQNAEGGFALAWESGQVNGCVDFDDASSPTQVWSGAIQALRDDPSRHPVAKQEAAREQRN